MQIRSLFVHLRCFLAAMALLGPACLTAAFAQTPLPGFPDLKLSRHGDATVHAFAVQPDGKTILAGDFRYVSGEVRNFLARLNADGTLDSSWQPAVDGPVYAVSVANGIVYVGGAFLHAGGVPRSYIAAFDSGGAVTPWAPEADNLVFRLAATSNTVYAAGYFLTIGGQPRARLAALDTATDTNNALLFAPNPDAEVKALMPIGSELLVAGQFQNISGQLRRGLARLDATGALTSWDPQVDGSVNAISASGTQLALVGPFSSVGGQARSSFAVVDVNTGGVTAAQTSVAGGIDTVALDGNTAYVGSTSEFYLNGERRYCVGAIDITTGSPLAFAPQSSEVCQMTQFGMHAGRLRMAGTYTRIGSTTAHSIADIDLAGSVTAGALTSRLKGAIDALVVLADGRIVLGGEFDSAGNHPLGNLARVNTDGTLDLIWRPRAEGRVLALAALGSIVYAGGQFLAVNGLTRNRLASIDSAGSVTAWDPNANGTVNALLATANFIYAGGDFTIMGTRGAARLSKIPVSTGIADYFGGGIIDGNVNALALSGTTLYVGGKFRTVSDLSGHEFDRFGLAAFNINTNVITPWDPQALTNDLQFRVRALLAANGRMYVGGVFESMGGANRSGLAAVDLTSGIALAWNPGAVSNAFSLVFDNGILYTPGSAYDTARDSDNVLAWSAAALSPAVIAAGGGKVFVGGSIFAALPLAALPSVAVQLFITGINAGAPPRAGMDFSVTVQSRDAFGAPAAVTSDTLLSLAVLSGTGTVSSGIPCQILAGLSTCSFGLVRYSKPEAGVRLQAARVSGDLLTAAQSAPFSVKTTVTVSVVKSPNVFTEVGQPATFVATVSGGSNPTGTVSFGLGGPGIGVAGCIPVTLAAGSATCTTSTQAPTNLQVFAIYSGDAIHEPAESFLGADALIAPFPSISVLKAGGGSGTVSSTPAGIDCNVDCTAEWPGGTSVTLTASPAIGSVFAGWSGGGCSGTAPCTQTLALLSGPRTVTATFELASVPLTVTRSGTGTGLVTSVPAGINCGADCDENYVGNTMVTLTATASGLSVFTGWSGGGCSGTGTCTLTMSAAQSVTANFTLPQYLLTVTSANGRVTSNPAGVDCPGTCAAPFNAGTMVTLTPTADSGFQFNGWLGACTGSGACVVSMDGGKSVTAQFGDPPPPPPALSSVSSIMLHGGFPESNPIQIGIPIDGNISIEPRLPNATSQLRFQFASTLTSIGGVTVKDRDGNTAGQAAAQRNGNTVDVTLSGIVVGKRLVVRIEALNGSATFAEVTLAFLPGDASRSGRVTAADISAIKANIGRTFNQTTFARFDLNADDQISAADVSIAKARVGRGIQ